VTHPQAVAHALQQVGAVAHRLHAPCDRNLDVTRRNALSGKHHRLQARPADFVDGQRANVLGEPAPKRSLACRRLTEACRHDVAHDAFLHGRGIDPRAAHGFAYDERAKLWSREVLETTEKLSRRRANRRNDDTFLHGWIIRWRRRRS
jgi:hypothetical protein